MLDVVNQTPLTVQTDSAGGPYLMVPKDQLADVQRVLDQHGVYYWVSRSAVSISNGPYIAFVHFGYKGDAQAVQRILDAA